MQQLQADANKVLTSADLKAAWRNIAKDLWESITFFYISGWYENDKY